MEGSRNDFQKRVLAEALSESFGLALLGGDSEEAEQVAREALESSLSEAMVYDLVVRPAMHRIGRLWQSGEISVAHEHLATQIATQVLVLTHDIAELPRHRRGQLAMLAAVEGELHVVALDMAAKLLESAGYDVLFLGADVPTESLPAIVADHEPALFLLSATTARAGARLPAAAGAIANAATSVGLIVGGAGVPGRLPPSPRLRIERSVARVVDAADSLLRRADLN